MDVIGFAMWLCLMRTPPPRLSSTSLARCYRTHLTKRIWLRPNSPSETSDTLETLYEIMGETHKWALGISNGIDI